MWVGEEERGGVEKVVARRRRISFQNDASILTFVEIMTAQLKDDAESHTIVHFK